MENRFPGMGKDPVQGHKCMSRRWAQGGAVDGRSWIRSVQYSHFTCDLWLLHGLLPAAGGFSRISRIGDEARAQF